MDEEEPDSGDWDAKVLFDKTKNNFHIRIKDISNQQFLTFDVDPYQADNALKFWY